MNSNVKLHLRTPHLLMVLFPRNFLIRAEISSRLGSANLKGITKMQQESPKAGWKAERGTPESPVSHCTITGWFPPQAKIKSELGVPKQNQSWPGKVRPGQATQGCGGRKGIREHLTQSGSSRFTAAAWLQTPQQGCVSCRNPLLVCLSVHPSLPLGY